MAWAERRALIGKIEAERKSRVICFVTSDRQGAEANIQKDATAYIFEHLRAIGKTPRLDVFLYTPGGDTLAAFGIARLFREFADHVGVLAPSRCHSAGTLLAISANEIVMTAGATLSPIDPSVVGPLNPAVEVAPGQRQIVPLSVETVAGFKALVTSDWDIKGEEALGAAFKLLAEKVHPLALGNVYRARQQIANLARKLLAEHRKDEKAVLDAIVDTLACNLGSHDYPISRREARDLLGKQIAQENGPFENLLLDLMRDYATELELATPFDPAMTLRAATLAGRAGPVKVEQRLAIVESAAFGLAAEREMLLSETRMLPPGVPPQMAAQFGGPKAIQAEIVRGEWRRYA
jgi:hypothetical protein